MTTRQVDPAPESSFVQSAMRIITLVAAREFTSRVINKPFLISTVIMLAVIVGGQVVASLVGDDDERATVSVVGGDGGLRTGITAAGTSLGTPVKVVPQSDAARARDAVRDGDVDVALLAQPGGGYTAVTESELDPQLRAVLTTATQQLSLTRALAQQRVDPAPLAEASRRAAVDVDALDPVDPDKGQRIALAYFAVLLLFFSVYLYGIYVAMGVVEEKSSRVVELLLATIRPIHLLVGKVLGIGAVGLLQVLVLGGAALATGLATGVVTIGTTALALYAAVVVWYVLGFAFFAMLYAACGSLVSRQEDVNAVTTPLNILAFAMFFAAQFSLTNPDNTWVTVLSWVPPFSSTLMPMRIAAGLAGPAQVALAIVVMLAATAVAAAVAARVYERSVLTTGARQSWRRALAKVR